MPVYEFGGLRPVIHTTAYVHPSAEVIGNVLIGRECTVGPCAVLRGDIGRVTIGDGSNVQDRCVFHTETDEQLLIGEDCTIGHGAILHGCTIRSGALVGMNAVVLDGAVVGEHSIVAAMALIKAGMQIPPRSLVAGVPGRILRDVTEDHIAAMDAGAAHYRHMRLRFVTELRAVEPLQEPEADRPAMPRH